MPQSQEQGTPPRKPLEPLVRMSPERVSKYYEKGYYQRQTIGQFLEEALEAYPDHCAATGLSLRGGLPQSSKDTLTWTYQNLEEESRRAALDLKSHGVRVGDRVLLQLPNVLEFLSYMTAAFRLGLIPIFCLPKHRERELGHFARMADAAVHVFAQGAENCDYWAIYQRYSQLMRAEGLEPPQALDITRMPKSCQSLPAKEDLSAEITHRGVAEDLALFQLSGGTTGLSKMIPRTHVDYLYSVRESARICQLSFQTKMLVVLPAAHNFTLSSPGILGVLSTGGSLVLAADPSPQTSFALIERHRANSVALVPALARAWALIAQRNHLSLESLQRMQVGGAKLSPSAARYLVGVLKVDLQQVFGMAEGLVNYTRLDDPLERILTTQGRPISPDDEILVLDDHDQPLQEGQEGHLLTRGPYTISGYYKDDKANRECFTADGFYRTGDIVIAHPGGYLEVVGRAKDQINRAGEKISVDELEDFALELAGVEDAVVVGLPDPAVGERICLVIQTRTPNLWGQDPLGWARERYRAAGFADYKLPERVEVLAQFPLTHVGKISRKQLRDSIVKALVKD